MNSLTRCLIRLAIFTAIITLAGPLTSLAQPILWQEDGVPLTDSYVLDVDEKSMAANTANQLLVVWRDDGAQPARVVRGQLFAANGDTLWNNDRVLAGMDGGHVTGYALEASPDGGWLLAWVTTRSDAPLQMRIQKISATGELLWYEPGGLLQEGVPAMPLDNGVSDWDLVADPSGGAWVAANRRTPDNLRSYVVQHLDSSGTPSPALPADGYVVETTALYSYHMEFMLGCGGSDNLWIAFTSQAPDIQDPALKLRQIHPSDPDSFDEMLLSDETVHSSDFWMISDGSGGAVATWEQGFSGINVQHVGADGVPVYPDNGFTVDLPPYQYPTGPPPVTAMLPDGDVIIAFAANYSQYAQRFTLEDQAVVPQWDEWSNFGSYTRELFLPVVNDTHIQVVSYHASDMGVWQNLTHHTLSTDGDVLGDPVEFFSYSMPDLPDPYAGWVAHSVTGLGNTVVALWEDSYPTHPLALRLQAVDGSDGSLLLPEGGMVLRDGIYAMDSATMAPANQDEAWFAYTDPREGLFARRPMLQKLDLADGGKLWNEPLDLLPGIGSPDQGDTLIAHRVDLEPLDDGSVLALTAHTHIYSPAIEGPIYAQKIAADGSLLWGDSGVSFGTTWARYHMVPDGGGGMLAVWSYWGDNYAARISADGNLMWSEGSDPYISLPFGDDWSPLVYAQADGTWILIGNLDSDLIALNLDGNGDITWTTTLSNSTPYFQVAVPMASGVMVMWRTDTGFSYQRVNGDGSLVWPETKWITVGDPGYCYLYSSGPDAQSVWFRYSDLAADELYLTRLRLDGFPDFPMIVYEDQSSIDVLVNPGEDAWIGYRDGDYLVQHLERNGQPAPSYSDGPVVLTSNGNADLETTLADGGALALWKDTNIGRYYGQRLAGETLDVDSRGGGLLQPDQFTLQPVFPNPFNPLARVTVDVPTVGDLRVTVFSLTGQRVGVLHDASVGPGAHTMLLDGSRLASGVYLVRAELPGHAVQTRKAVLLK